MALGIADQARYRGDVDDDSARLHPPRCFAGHDEGPDQVYRQGASEGLDSGVDSRVHGGPNTRVVDEYADPRELCFDPAVKRKDVVFFRDIVLEAEMRAAEMAGQFKHPPAGKVYGNDDVSIRGKRIGQDTADPACSACYDHDASCQRLHESFAAISAHRSRPCDAM